MRSPCRRCVESCREFPDPPPGGPARPECGRDRGSSDHPQPTPVAPAGQPGIGLRRQTDFRLRPSSVPGVAQLRSPYNTRGPRTLVAGLSMTPAEPPAPKAERLVEYEHSLTFVPLLRQLRCSLLVSTYQAGKLVVVGTDGDQLALGFHNFDRPMGMAVRPDRLALAARDHVWLLRSAP